MKQQRDYGERAAAAVIGGLFGLVLGVGTMLAIYLIEPARGSQYQVLWATAAYCALFAFAFGEELADVIAMFVRVFGLLLSIGGGVALVEPDASWIRSTVVFLLFMAPLAGVIFLAIR